MESSSSDQSSQEKIVIEIDVKGLESQGTDAEEINPNVRVIEKVKPEREDEVMKDEGDEKDVE